LDLTIDRKKRLRYALYRAVTIENVTRPNPTSEHVCVFPNAHGGDKPLSAGMRYGCQNALNEKMISANDMPIMIL
jgi:hypothetical protein